MKIAITSDGKSVSGHFGHCECFTIYEVEEGKLIKKGFIQNPEHVPGYLPVYLKSLNVDVIIAGKMDGSAQELFTQNGIEVVTGAQGASDDAANLYLVGSLKSTGSICTEHAHVGHCNE